jgi:aminoglycoside phosphotransferase (APT) family kinase protein
MTIYEILSQQFSLHGVRLIEVQPGWSASAYRVEADNKLYFLKVYDKQRYSSKMWIQGIDQYIPAIVWLGEHSALRGKIPHVIPTVNGGYKHEDSECVYILFDWITGITPRDEPLTKPQLEALAEIIAQLHNVNVQTIPSFGLVHESYDIPFYDSLMSRARNADENIPNVYLQVIIEKLHQLSEASRTLISLNLPITLCHNDIHGWNVITQGDKLILLDWEGLRFAPRESDLFMFKFERYWGQRWDEFNCVYKKQHPNSEISETAMRFFQLRRRLEDIDAFIDNITLDNGSTEVVAEARDAIVRECGLL